MAITQQLRQSQLFAAEDWRVIYTAFTQINFNAYDFSSIRTAMINYIRLNYPEDFNDWVESSEFVALIDLLAYLGQSLAFRMDLNTRENFLDTATRRESIFRLARMLNYQPQRCIPASGLVKITAVITDQPIYDSYGTNLQNVQIIWNDQNNPDWFEQFILVMNATLNSTNTFGNPSKSGLVSGVETQLYEMNNVSIPLSVIPFTASIAGNNVQLELANATFNEGSTTSLANSGNFYEIDPDPLNSWNIVYRADGNGYASANTGFFLYFKQGSMQYKDYQCSLPLANRVIDVDTDGVNQTDVWVQTIDSTGLVSKKWTKVPSVNGFNVIYNSIDKNIRNIYSVVTRDSNGNDQISVRFADGNFGNVPIGIVRVWHRISNNLTYQIRPSDISNQVFAFAYVDNLNNAWNVAFTTNLQYTVNNAQSTEDNYRIAQNAPQTYYTQDRMVNGEDYNLFPLQDARILKNKAVNRVYSGQSRYLDLNDPTGSYNDLNVFGTDGILYMENDLNMRDVVNSPGTNALVVVNTQIQPLVNGSFNSQTQALELKNFFYYSYPRVDIGSGYVWKTITSLTTSCTGAFFTGSTAVAVGTNAPVNSPLQYVTQGSLVGFSNPSTGKNTLASLIGVIGDGTGINLSGKVSGGEGAITISTLLGQGYQPSYVIASFRTTFTQDESIAIAAQLQKHVTFGVRYNASDLTWKVITSDNLSASSSFSLDFAGNTSSTNKDASWMIKVVWTGAGWRIYSRAMRYIFESERQNRFYFENTKKVFDPNTNTAQLDYVSVLSINPDSTTGLALSQDYLWQITGQQIYPDGFADPRSVRLTMWEGDNYGIPDDPDEFNEIVDPQMIPSRMIFWNRKTSSDGYQYWYPVVIPTSRIYSNPGLLPTPTDANWTTGEVAYIISNGVFYQYAQNTFIDVTPDYKMRIGRNNLSFLWKHFAPTDQRINPAVMNIIDMYTLTSAYDTDLRNWIATNGSMATMPQPLSSAELKAAFVDLEQYKQMTDQMIWHPVSYKVIFGSQAAPEYQAKFKVVKTPGTTVTDNEVKSLVIQAVNQYFSLSNWDFGQSFFFTELAAYIHQVLATIVGSVVITPLNAQAKFGDLFEIACDADEIFISGARVTDVQIVPSLTESVLGISNG
jgi:hypothetical protein